MEEELLRLMGEYGLIEPAAENCQVLIQSFSAESLMKIHELEPSLPLIQLYWAGSSKAIQSDLDAAIAYAVGIGPYKKDVDAALVEAAHERCLAVHPSTVNTVEEMEELIALGVDGIFTNNPDLLDGVLGDAALSSPRTRNTPPAQEGTICCLLWSNCRSWLGRSPWRLVCSDAQIGFAESSAESCPIASWLQHKPKPKAPRATRLSPS
jgi:glycerophosphoryl diester phosphodiesterase